MSEIKKTCRGTSMLIEAATMTYEEYLNLHTQGAKELRAAYEALENERDELKQSLDDLQERFNGIKFIESELRKELEEFEVERNRREEMRKALEAQMENKL